MKTVLSSFVLLLVLATSSLARDIVDMAGRAVTVPDHIERVVGCVAPVNWMIYAVAPMKLAAFTSAPSQLDWEILDPRLRDRPVIGSFLGGQGVNTETLLALRPDVVVFWGWGKSPVAQRWLQQLNQWHIPVVFVAMDQLEQYPATLEFLGDLLGEPERGKTLANYGRNVLAEVAATVAAIPASRVKSVYYAQGPDGLETEPEHSFHAELIPLSGGVNVHKGRLKQRTGREKLTLEQVLLYNPEVILATDRLFARQSPMPPGWQQIRAVQNGKVYLIPDYPLNWFDRPPSMMRFIGVQWLTWKLYPEDFTIDMVDETRKFYHLFFNHDLSEKRVRELLMD